MPIFHREAYLAACGEKEQTITAKLVDDHFDLEDRLDEALAWLSDEQRCDALYGDWLLQLNSPSGPPLLAVRDLLIDQGAIDANYLAELAQNADDASDGQSAEVKVIHEGEWLVFANNGRKVTSANLRGLCRFFCHGEAITRETIGKFGIGFKSCYRIASEVFVHTWEGQDSFAFRLPISRADDAVSHPLSDKLTQLRSALAEVGQRIPERILQPERLGYCTPEFVERLPRQAESILRTLRDPQRGAAFCLHLHAAGQKEVARRITGQSREVYELCPLFLPNLKAVTVQKNGLKMVEGRRLQADAIENVVSAMRVTLETTTEDGTSNDRFWRLRGEAPDDMWSLCLHADSEFRLTSRGTGKNQFGLKEGAAYAYFPLMGVPWPLRIHLHIDLPTNLSRGSWNVDVEHEVRRQIRSAAHGLSAWLANQSARWISTWSIEDVFLRQPVADDGWAFHFYRELVQGAKEHAIVGTVWGTPTTTSDARSVSLIANSRFKDSWVTLSAHLPDAQRETPIVLETEKIDLGIPALNGEQLRSFFVAVLAAAGDEAESHKVALRAVFGVQDAPVRILEAILARIQVRRTNGSIASVRDLMTAPGDADLADGWHEVFQEVNSWLPRERKAINIFGSSLGRQLERLSRRTFSVGWEDLLSAMATKEQWEQNGDRFWAEPRAACPAHLRKKVIQVLQVKDSRGKWTPITETWLIDNNPVNCFHGVVRRWDSHSDGYTSPDEAAVELMEEELQPFVDQAKRYHELDMRKQERDYCAGVILGLYRYEKESKSEFRNWSEDLPLDSAGWLRDEWRERNADKAMRDTMDEFIRERCPGWAKNLCRVDSRKQ
jgi:hypothetical protein